MRLWLGVLAAVLVGCGVGATDPAAVPVAGRVWRGPTAPVCRPDAPCEAPVAGEFVVTAGGRFVVAFRTGADGRFSIRLVPASYRVQWTGNALGQVLELVVGPSGTTDAGLHFDTGIR